MNLRDIVLWRTNDADCDANCFAIMNILFSSSHASNELSPERNESRQVLQKVLFVEILDDFMQFMALDAEALVL